MVRQNLTRKLVVCIVAVMTLIAWRARPQEARPKVQYRVTDLGIPAGCDDAYATGVNDAGQVVGYADHHIGRNHGGRGLSHPFVWQKERFIELPVRAGERGRALAINSRGDVAGLVTTADDTEKPVLWTRAKQYARTPLSELVGWATCLLDDGTAAGWCAARNDREQAVVWKKGTMRVLGNPDDDCICNGINGKGIAVGWFVPQRPATEKAPLLPIFHAAMWKDGQRIALPELGGAVSECEAVNESGTAVGWSDTKNGRSACVWKDQQVEVLPTLNGYDGYNMEAHSINRSGVIVGDNQGNDYTGNPLACLWREGKVEDLNGLIPANSGWKLHVASHISDRGLIVGYGFYDKDPNHQWRAFLLTPVMTQSDK